MTAMDRTKFLAECIHADGFRTAITYFKKLGQTETAQKLEAFAAVLYGPEVWAESVELAQKHARERRT